MKTNLQTILGSGGAIGTPLAKYLAEYTENIRLVSRNPRKVNPSDELMKADLTVQSSVDKAVEGSAVVYLTIGLEYKASVWHEKWPVIMRNVINSCKKHKAKLVFLDNVYMYDRSHLNLMNEETPILPSSKKGVVRTIIADMLLLEMKSGELDAIIARSADFLSSRNSILIELIYNNFKKRKSAAWLLSDSKLHNFTYSKDAAKAMAFLGNTDSAYNEIWHLPTHRDSLNGKDWIELFAKKLRVEPKYNTMSMWMLSLIGIFVPVLREIKEMCYQYDRHYFFDSSKIEKRFGLFPTPLDQAVDEVLEELSGD